MPPRLLKEGNGRNTLRGPLLKHKDYTLGKRSDCGIHSAGARPALTTTAAFMESGQENREKYGIPLGFAVEPRPFRPWAGCILQRARLADEALMEAGLSVLMRGGQTEALAAAAAAAARAPDLGSLATPSF